MNVLQALTDHRLLGGLPQFADLTTWQPWLAFVRAVFGLPMDDDDLARFRQHTGRDEPRLGGYPEAVCIVGVQSGKSQIAAALADHAALVGAPGTYALLVGQDLRGAMRVLLEYAREPFEQLDAFKAEVVRETADAVELRNKVSLAAYPCKPASIRGLRACIVVIDELAFFTTTDGRPTDREMLRVARGRVATTGGKIIILSSPYAEAGELYELHRKHYGREDSPTLVWQAAAHEMNPTLSADYLERMETNDPDAYQSEVLGQFRAGTSLLFDGAALDACLATDVRERAPQPGAKYVCYIDAAGGRSHDSFAMAIAHHEHKVAYLDAVRVWAPPFNPSGAIAEIADLCRRYNNIGEVQGDAFANGFVFEQFAAQRITYAKAERSTSDTYLELVPHVNTAAVSLLDVAGPLRELRTLVRKRGPSGRDRVDHRSGAHDDQAAATAGALVLASARSTAFDWRAVGMTSECTWALIALFGASVWR